MKLTRMTIRKVLLLTSQANWNENKFTNTKMPHNSGQMIRPSQNILDSVGVSTAFFPWDEHKQNYLTLGNTQATNLKSSKRKLKVHR